MSPDNNSENTYYNANFSIKITDKEFNFIKKLVYDQFGIMLTEKKKSLVNGRLQQTIKNLGFNDFDSYFKYVLNDGTGNAVIELVNKITTNHTFFYRESDHFDYFTEKAFPELIIYLKQQKSKDIRIWSAGCSSGEEPYMLVMLMMEILGRDYSFWDAGILATDISDRALLIAKSAIYPPEKMKALPKKYLSKYFHKLKSGQYQVNENVKKEVTYRRFNLMNKSMPFKKRFHMIFCRNVMIYFDTETRMQLVERFYNILEPGGYLFIGHSETLGRKSLYRYIKPALYQKV